MVRRNIRSARPKPLKRVPTLCIVQEHTERELKAFGFKIPLYLNDLLTDLPKELCRPYSVVKFWANKGYFDTLYDVRTRATYVHPDTLNQIIQRRNEEAYCG